MAIAYWLHRNRYKHNPIYEYDRPTGVRCPRPDCELDVYYNGNYFCACGWALPDVGEEKHPGMAEFLKKLKKEMAIRYG